MTVKDNFVLIDRQRLLAELQRVFDVPTATTMLSVLDQVAAQVHAAGVSREDFRELKQIVAELAAAQQRTEQRVAELAAAQQRTEERLAHLEEMMAELIEAQKRTEERLVRLEDAVAELVAAQRRTEDQMVGFRKEQQRLWDKFARADGRALEGIYRDKATAYFSPLVWRAQLVPQPEVVKRLEGKLTEPLLYDLLLADLIARGQARPPVPAGEVWLVAEVSVTIDREDVERVIRRASLLRQIGLTAVAAVAGDTLTEGAAAEARTAGVAVLQDGRIQFKDEALAAAAGKNL
jgi:hypothetical protein